jgi:hypothetical protein
MKRWVLASAVLLGWIPWGAMANCSTQQVKNNDLRALLLNNTMCVPNAGGGWSYQEEHISPNILKDYKKGPGDPVDPEKVLGTWTYTTNGSNSAVTYNYTAFGNETAGPFTFKVYLTSGTLGADGSTYDFCKNDGVVASATLRTGTGNPCR